MGEEVTAFRGRNMFSRRRRGLRDHLGIVGGRNSLCHMSGGVDNTRGTRVTGTFGEFLRTPAFGRCISVKGRVTEALNVGGPDIRVTVSVRRDARRTQGCVESRFGCRRFADRTLCGVVRDNGGTDRDGLVVHTLGGTNRIRGSGLSFSEAVSLLKRGFRVTLRNRRKDISVRGVISFLGDKG